MTYFESSQPRNATNSQTSIERRWIAQIQIEKLFGQYNYTLQKCSDGADLSRLFILYGANGSGKTTILKLIYHTLSPELERGHRSFLSRTQFARFAITLNDGTIIEALRLKRKSGSKHLRLSLHKSNDTTSVQLPIDSDGGVPASPNLSVKQQHLLGRFSNSLAQLQLGLHYVSDDRRHQGELDARTDLQRVRRSKGYFASDTFEHGSTDMSTSHPLFLAVSHDQRDSHELTSPERATQKLTAWARQQTQKASTRGQVNSFAIYTTVARDIVAPPPPQIENHSAERDRLLNRLTSVQQRSTLYGKYGLTATFDSGEELTACLQSADQHRLPLLLQVIAPHIDGIAANLEALTNIYNTIDTLTSTLNNFYQSKTVNFSLSNGFSIKSTKPGSRSKIELKTLSSGEKQLLLLLCNAVLASDRSTIFLIDEPELSLNVEWQRNLIPALLANSNPANTQFFLATHSLELLTQHRSNVTPLSNTPRISRKREH